MTTTRPARRPAAGSTRVLQGLAIGACCAAVAVVAGLGGVLAALVGLVAGYWAITVLAWTALWPLAAEETRNSAVRAELPTVLEEVFIVAVPVCAIVAVGLTLVLGDPGLLPATLALVAVFGAWASLHAMYAARYAALYYGTDDDGADDGGIDFNQQAPPAYRDFFYFSYNLGMTYQVSDTDVSGSRIRATALRQCLVSYVFGAVILATAINLVAGLVT